MTNIPPKKIQNRVKQAIQFKEKRTALSKPIWPFNGSRKRRRPINKRGGTVYAPRCMNTTNSSMRGYHKILKVARTIADLNQHELIEIEDLAEAVSFRMGKIEPV